MTRLDAASIANGTTPRDIALWQIGAHYLNHTNHLSAIHRGITTGEHLGGHGGGSSHNDGLWIAHGPRGVTIEQHYDREPRTPEEESLADFLASFDGRRRIIDSRRLWRTTWPPIVAIVRPVLTGPIWDEIAAASRQRRDATPKYRPGRLDPYPENWAEIEDRCHAAAAAAWAACQPTPTLFDDLEGNR